MALEALKASLRERREAMRQARLVADFERHREPWTAGYFLARERYTHRVLNDTALLKSFHAEESIPLGYGLGFDERVVEYPWIVTKLLQSSGQRLLDAGSCLNFRYLLEHPAINERDVTVVNLQPEVNCFWNKRVSYLFNDLRELPIRDNWFDIVVCLSTLEHVGMDNSGYTGEKSEKRPQDYLVAVSELVRVLKPGGRLFFSVPYGEYLDAGNYQRFNTEMLDKITIQLGSSEREFYQYDARGWKRSSAEAALGPAPEAISSGAVALISSVKG